MKLQQMKREEALKSKIPHARAESESERAIILAEAALAEVVMYRYQNFARYRKNRNRYRKKLPIRFPIPI